MGDLDYFTEGMRAYHLGDYSAAVEALAHLTARKDLPGKLARYYCAMAHRTMGIEHARAERFRQAARHLRQAVALIGNRADLAEYLLVVYAKTARYERCADEAEVLSGLRGNDVAARVRLAQAQWRAGRRPMAVMTLTGALRELGDKYELHLNLGLFYAAEEDFGLAETHLGRAVECDCTSAEAQHYFGLVASARGDFHRAAQAFQQACGLDPSNLMFAYQLCLAADAAARAHQPVKLTLPESNQPTTTSQIRQLAEYVAAEPDFIGAFLALPISDADEKLFGVIVSVLRTALAYHDDYADLHYYTGLALARLGEFDEAAVHATRAVQINPRYIKALLHLADLDARRGATLQAAAHLRQALRAGADFPDVHARLGDLMKQCGKADSARKHYRRALELNRHYSHAADGMASLAA